MINWCWLDRRKFCEEQRDFHLVVCYWQLIPLPCKPLLCSLHIIANTSKVYVCIESETSVLDITLLHAIHNLRQENVSVLVWWNLSNYKSQKVLRCVLAKFLLFNMENLQDLNPLWNLCLKSITVMQNPHLCEFLSKWLAVACKISQNNVKCDRSRCVEYTGAISEQMVDIR